MTLKQSFRYRNLWMGIAMIWVIWSHLPMEIPIAFFRSVKNMGYGGVDIFLFASGIGCYFSLEKDAHYISFIKRRVQRLLPTYWIFLAFWIAYRKIFEYISVYSIIGNIFCVSNFNEKNVTFNWYISAIWLLYLIAPIMKSLIDEIHSKIEFAIMIIILLLISVSFWNGGNLITVSRIPIFFIGMYFAKMAKVEKEEIRSRSFVILFGITIVGIIFLRVLINFRFDDMWDKGYWWYPFILIVPGLCMFISLIGEKIKGIRIIDIIGKGIEWIGKYSFELFLLHIWFIDIYNMLVTRNLISNKRTDWMIIVVLLVPGCIILNNLENIILAGFNSIYNYVKRKIRGQNEF